MEATKARGWPSKGCQGPEQPAEELHQGACEEAADTASSGGPHSWRQASDEVSHAVADPDGIVDGEEPHRPPRPTDELYTQPGDEESRGRTEAADWLNGQLLSTARWSLSVLLLPAPMLHHHLHPPLSHQYLPCLPSPVVASLQVMSPRLLPLFSSHTRHHTHNLRDTKWERGA